MDSSGEKNSLNAAPGFQYRNTGVLRVVEDLSLLFDFIFLDFYELINPRSRQKRELDEIKWLNMNLKPDKECEKRGDIVFLSEIIRNSMYYPDNTTQASPYTRLFDYYNVVLFINFLTMIAT